MYLSEDNFVHLRAVKERDLLRDLEQRRVQLERWVPQPSLGSRLKHWLGVSLKLLARQRRGEGQPQSQGRKECPNPHFVPR